MLTSFNTKNITGPCAKNYLKNLTLDKEFEKRWTVDGFIPFDQPGFSKEWIMFLKTYLPHIFYHQGAEHQNLENIKIPEVMKSVWLIKYLKVPPPVDWSCVPDNISKNRVINGYWKIWKHQWFVGDDMKAEDDDTFFTDLKYMWDNMYIVKNTVEYENSCSRNYCPNRASWGDMCDMHAMIKYFETVTYEDWREKCHFVTCSLKDDSCDCDEVSDPYYYMYWLNMKWTGYKKMLSDDHSKHQRAEEAERIKAEEEEERIQQLEEEEYEDVCNGCISEPCDNCKPEIKDMLCEKKNDNFINVGMLKQLSEEAKHLCVAEDCTNHNVATTWRLCYNHACCSNCGNMDDGQIRYSNLKYTMSIMLCGECENRFKLYKTIVAETLKTYFDEDNIRIDATCWAVGHLLSEQEDEGLFEYLYEGKKIQATSYVDALLKIMLTKSTPEDNPTAGDVALCLIADEIEFITGTRMEYYTTNESLSKLMVGDDFTLATAILEWAIGGRPVSSQTIRLL